MSDYRKEACELVGYGLKNSPVLSLDMIGSQTIEGAATNDSDVDFIVLTKNRVETSKLLAKNFFYFCGEYYEEPDIWAYRSNNSPLNIILIEDEAIYQSKLLANEVCRELRLTVKESRILVFESHRTMVNIMKELDELE